MWSIFMLQHGSKLKKNKLAVDEPKNLIFLIERSNRIADKKVKSIVQTCIQRNAFFAHSENLLLAQLSSKNISERSSGVDRILQIRETIPSHGIRRFKVPTINFKAKNWTKMIYCDERTTITKPPFTVNLNEEELMDLIDNPLSVPRFKCHTQMV